MEDINQTENWFFNISDDDFYDIAIDKFKMYMPVVTRHKSRLGVEYIDITGYKYDTNGKIKNETLLLGYVGPVRIDLNDRVILDLEKVEDNLEACKSFIHFIDSKNIGKIYKGKTYPQVARSVYDHIIKTMKRKDDMHRELA